MRRRIFFTAIMIAMVGSTTFAGTDKPEIVITNFRSHVKVIYDADERCNAQISIADTYGKVLFSENIYKESGFIRPYDLSQLPNGRYEVTVKNLNTNEVTVKTVTNYVEEAEMLAHVNDIPGKDNEYLLTVANQNNKMVTIEIFDESNDRLYHEKRRVEDDYGCVFVIKNVPFNEELTFHIKNNAASKFIRVN